MTSKNPVFEDVAGLESNKDQLLVFDKGAFHLLRPLPLHHDWMELLDVSSEVEGPYLRDDHLASKERLCELLWDDLVKFLFCNAHNVLSIDVYSVISFR